MKRLVTIPLILFAVSVGIGGEPPRPVQEGEKSAADRYPNLQYILSPADYAAVIATIDETDGRRRADRTLVSGVSERWDEWDKQVAEETAGVVRGIKENPPQWHPHYRRLCECYGGTVTPDSVWKWSDFVKLRDEARADPEFKAAIKAMPYLAETPDGHKPRQVVYASGQRSVLDVTTGRYHPQRESHTGGNPYCDGTLGDRDIMCGPPELYD